MKKLIVVVLVILLAVGVGFWFFEKAEAPVDNNPASTETATYKSPTLGLSFTYPKILAVSEKNGILSVHHEVNFVHHDFCDFKGEGDTTIPVMPDFHLDMYTRNLGLVATMKQESPYIPKENFVNGQVVASPGFIDSVQFGSLSGFAIFEGAEGCGQTTYYFPLSNSNTLVVKQKLITVFTGSIDVENKAKAEAVPGVINREKETAILKALLESVKIN